MTPDTDSDATAPPLDLRAHRWRHRLLLLFAPAADDARYRRQLERLEAHAAGLLERDLLPLHLLAAAPPAVPPRPTDLVGTPADAAELRARFGVDDPAFRVVLLGKDGGAKREWAEPVEPAEVFAEIDAMPMRRREMRERSGGG